MKSADIARWRAGNTGVEGVWQFDSGRPGRRLLVTALVHGNERCGAYALDVVLAHGLRPERGCLTMAFCNLAAFDRFDMAQPDASRFVEEDLNRVWSDTRIDGRATAECRRAAELRPFVKEADCLLDLHSMHEPGSPLLLPGTNPRHLAWLRAVPGWHWPVIVDAGHDDGVRLRDYGAFAPGAAGDATAVLIECGHHLEPRSTAVALDAIARVVVHTGCADPSRVDSSWLLESRPAAEAVGVTHRIVASSERVRFSRPWRSLERVPHAGTVLGDDDGKPIVTPYDNCVLVMPSLRQLRAGVTVLRLGRAIA